MPRVAGVSMSSTVWPMRRRPMPCTVFACVLLNPIGLFTSVILTVLPSAISLPRLVLAAQPTDGRGILQAHQAGEGRAHDVVRVRGPDRLGQDILDAAGLHDRANGAARDDARAVRRRLEQHLAGPEAAEHRVRNGRAGERNAD